MSAAANLPFERLSFSRQFMLAVAAILAIAMVALGAWLGRQVEGSAINRAANVTSAYVESVVAGFLHDRDPAGQLSTGAREALDRVFLAGPLRHSVVSFKVWDRSGRILYSEDPSQIGRQYAVEPSLAQAFAGRIQSHITYPDRPDNSPGLGSQSRLLEVYVPVRLGKQPEPAVVAEFYHAMGELDAEIRVAQWSGWALLGMAGIAIYAVLYGRVRRADRTIVEQQQGLREQLSRLHASLEDNELMRRKLSEAGARSTALNERLLQRVAADLHDGPAQDVSYALLRFDDMARGCHGCERAAGSADHDLRAIPAALASSLDEMRAIAAGLGAPRIGDLSLSEVAWRAIHEGEQKRGTPIAACVEALPGEATLASRITLFRVLQESIGNAGRHAPGAPLWIEVGMAGPNVVVQVSDEGEGFDPGACADGPRLGLALMRERVRLLGGCFEIDSAPGRGTRITASIPVAGQDMADG